jgi:NADH-quinone oxidoreductase subunit A
MFLANYLNVFVFLIIGAVLATIIFVIPYLLSTKTIERTKNATYECGFNPFEDTRNEFDVKFYLVAILFIIFDLEISFLFPFVLCLNDIHNLSVYSMFVFLIVLTVGFIYE